MGLFKKRIKGQCFRSDQENPDTWEGTYSDNNGEEYSHNDLSYQNQQDSQRFSHDYPDDQTFYNPSEEDRTYDYHGVDQDRAHYSWPSSNQEGPKDFASGLPSGNYRLDRRFPSDEASMPDDASDEPLGHRSKYSYRIDHFLNNGIIILTILLIVVLLIAFIV